MTMEEVTRRTMIPFDKLWIMPIGEFFNYVVYNRFRNQKEMELRDKWEKMRRY